MLKVTAEGELVHVHTGGMSSHRCRRQKLTQVQAAGAHTGAGGRSTHRCTHMCRRQEHTQVQAAGAHTGAGGRSTHRCRGQKHTQMQAARAHTGADGRSSHRWRQQELTQVQAAWAHSVACRPRPVSRTCHSTKRITEIVITLSITWLALAAVNACWRVKECYFTGKGIQVNLLKLKNSEYISQIFDLHIVIY